MPMNQGFKSALFPMIPDLENRFASQMIEDEVDELQMALSPGFHVYDEFGIRTTIKRMQESLFGCHPGNNFFAVKACPNLFILKLMLECGFGLDCSSLTELYRARLVGAGPGQVMFTSNNTDPRVYQYALDMGCILNLDDIGYLDKLPSVPEIICFRYNPGDRRSAGSSPIIGTPVNQKYGLRHDQIVDAFRRARSMGIEKFGLHAMYASNCLDADVLAGNARMLLEVVELVQESLPGIRFDFINIGGGFGVNYNPEHQALDTTLVSDLINKELDVFKDRHGYVPLLYTEAGRYVTGPNGVLVGRVINIMDKYKKFVGVSFCDAADILRAGIYPAHHEVSILDSSGREKLNGPMAQVSIVGPLCENIHMVSDRRLPVINEGDYVVVHDTGAHGIAMGMNYNGFGKSQELLLQPDGSVIRISRAETIGDLLVRELELFT